MSLINRVLHDLEDRHAFLSMQPQSVLSDLRSAQDYAQNRNANNRFVLFLGVLLILGAAAVLIGRELPAPALLSAREIPEPKARAETRPAPAVEPAVTPKPAPIRELHLKLDDLPVVAVTAAPADAPVMSAPGPEPRLLNLEVTSDGYAAVINLLFDRPPRYSLHVLENPPRLLVQLPKIEMPPQSLRALPAAGLIEGLRIGGEGGTSKLIFDLKGPVEIADARITPGSGDVYRFEIRLSATQRPEDTILGLAEEIQVPDDVEPVIVQPATQPTMEVVRRAPPPTGSAEREFQAGAGAYRIGDMAAAIDYFHRAIVAEPGHLKARRFLVSILVQQGDLESAARYAEEGLRFHQQDPVLLRVLARIHFEQGDTDAALGVLARGHPALQDDPDYYALMAAILQKQAKHAESAELYGRLLQLDPQRGVWWAGLGISLEAIGRPTEARRAFERAQRDVSAPANLRSYSAERIAAIGGKSG
jgi:MSHA biogenesis protein MshN